MAESSETKLPLGVVVCQGCGKWNAADVSVCPSCKTPLASGSPDQSAGGGIPAFVWIIVGFLAFVGAMAAYILWTDAAETDRPLTSEEKRQEREDTDRLMREREAADWEREKAHEALVAATAARTPPAVCANLPVSKYSGMVVGHQEQVTDSEIVGVDIRLVFEEGANDYHRELGSKREACAEAVKYVSGGHPLRYVRVRTYTSGGRIDGSATGGELMLGSRWPKPFVEWNAEWEPD